MRKFIIILNLNIAMVGVLSILDLAHAQPGIDEPNETTRIVYVPARTAGDVALDTVNHAQGWGEHLRAQPIDQDTKKKILWGFGGVCLIGAIIQIIACATHSSACIW